MISLKKLLAGLLVLGVFVPAFAFAETASTTGTALVGQIQTLQTQIHALQQQQQGAIALLVSTFRQGSSGDQVAILQALLAADPSIYPEGIVSGTFGKLTAQAVKRFQKKNGLEQVGNVGPKTLKKLQEFLLEHPLGFNLASPTSATSTVSQREAAPYRHPCAIIPPGHFIAPGWLKKHEGEDRSIVPLCQNLPKGIKELLDDGRDGNHHDGDHHATTTPPVPDTTAPVISALGVSNLASTTATVSWQTNEAATSKLYYGTTTPVSLGSALIVSDSSLVTSHALGLTGLATSTTYYYVLESKDAAANTATTSTQSFVTTAL